ncbi:Dyp-type peroxidase [Nocardioides sp.]|jgi:Dyp-type peroxidase family|uniref:Dyp-type peroxidase n=1 Tax=Nocardioides sp. TaxID=35761 RepID=UPI002633691B|nr:Dyp-type peroxidase [Nocardioides sp.]MDI6911241.1 Dyp-type peroxidase [Nocardioides sp.]
MAQAKGVLPSKEDDREVLYKNPQTCGYFVAIRLRPDITAEQVQGWLASLDQAVDALVVREEPIGGESKGRKLASVAVGFAPSFFDRLSALGIPLERPAGFTPEASPPTARFGGAPEMPADALLYVASVMEFRVEELLRALMATPVIESVGLERGYQRVDETEPFGYRDGVRNVKSSKRTQVVYVHRDGGQPDEPVWAEGGTYMVTMKILQNPSAFASLGDDATRDAVMGRNKEGTRLDLPPGSDPHEESPDVPDSLPPNAHVRKAGPRGHHDDNEIFRRGMPFVEAVNGSVQVGLHFCSFQATPNQFDAVFNDWMMNQQFPPRADGTVAGPDALMGGGSASGPLVQMQHSGIFFVPPYNAEGIASTLKPTEPHKHKTGRVAVNKIVRDPNDPSKRFERAGFIFEVHDAAGAVIEGSQFTTASNGRGVCEAELELGQNYTLVETGSPHVNITLARLSFSMDKPNLLLRVENVFTVPAPGYGTI